LRCVHSVVTDIYSVTWTYLIIKSADCGGNSIRTLVRHHWKTGKKLLYVVSVVIFSSLVNERIEYKLLSLTYKVLTTSKPSYLNNLISLQPLSTNHLLIENHRSLIQICITQSLESTTSRFIASASPVMYRLTSSFTCQLIPVIITTLIIHHSFTLSFQAQNLPKATSSTNPCHLNTSTTPGLRSWSWDQTYHVFRFIFSSFFL